MPDVLIFVALPPVAVFGAHVWSFRRGGALRGNEPWLVAGFGPTLTIAVVMAFVLFAAIRIDDRGVLPSQKCAPQATPGPNSRPLHVRQ